MNGAITSCGASQLWRAALFRVGDAAADVVGCNAAMSACEWLWAAELLEPWNGWGCRGRSKGVTGTDVTGIGRVLEVRADLYLEAKRLEGEKWRLD